jgi:hypothetical protein
VIRRLRIVLPPPEIVFVYVLLYIVFSAIVLWAGRAGGGAAPRKLVMPRIAIETIAIMGYGAYRVLAFHPFYRPSYRRWLESTPWTWPKHLPIGPVHLIWADAVVLLAAGLPGWSQGDFEPLPYVSLFLGPYLIALGVALWGTGEWAIGFGLLFGAGLMLALWEEPQKAYVAAGVVTYILGLVGLVRSYKRWPWALGWQGDLEQLTQGGREAGGSTVRLGWPFDRIAPKFPGRAPAMHWRNSVLLSLLAGWWFFAASQVLPSPGRLAIAALVLGNLCVAGPLLRVAFYVDGYAPPLNIWARIVRFRWIIPSYDQVFATPIAACAIGSLTPFWLTNLGFRVDVACALALAPTLLALLLGGPSRRTWWLTGKHRIVPAARAASGLVEVG